MTPVFARYLKAVAVGHASLLLVVGVGSTIQGCLPTKAEPIFPVGLILPPDSPLNTGGKVDIPAPPVPPKNDPPPPAVAPVPPTPPPPPKPKDPALTISKTGTKPNVQANVQRTKKPPDPPPPRVTARDLAKLKSLLNKRDGNTPPAGIPTGSPNVSGAVLDDEMRCRGVIYRALHDAWIERPSQDEVGSAAAEIAFRFDRFGRIIGRELVKSSGNKNMDKSAMDGAAAVEQIVGLTDEFLRRHSYRWVMAYQLGDE